VRTLLKKNHVVLSAVISRDVYQDVSLKRCREVGIYIRGY